MNTPTNSENRLPDQDLLARTAALRSARLQYLRARWARLFGTMVAALRAGGMRRELISLSDRQLRDAGIDLTLAGRGKAAAVKPGSSHAGSR